jgi:hypothetical protein
MIFWAFPTIPRIGIVDFNGGYIELVGKSVSGRLAARHINDSLCLRNEREMALTMTFWARLSLHSSRRYPTLAMELSELNQIERLDKESMDLSFNVLLEGIC